MRRSKGRFGRGRQFGPTQLTLFAAVAAFGQMASTVALAQQAAQSTAGGGSGQLEEIVVTAQKRSEDLTKVPASISVLSGAALQEQHIENFQDITRALPGVSFNAGSTVSGGPVGPGTTNINIRGISSVSGSATVSVYMDEVSITQGNLYDGSAEPKFLDFDRVEVLRGPQGTLFGASSMGGNLRFISKKVDLDNFGGDINADLSGTDHGDVNYSLDATANVPIVPGKWGLRFSAQSGYNSGYIDHYNPNGDGQLLQSGTNTERWTAFRFSSKMQFDDTLSATLAMFYQHDHTADTPLFYLNLGTFKQDKPVNEPITDNVFIPSLTIEKDFDSFTLTSATGFFQRDFDFQDDGTVFNSLAVSQFFLDGAGGTFTAHQPQNDAILGTIPSPVHRNDRAWQESEEIRLTSKDATLFGNPLNWIAGVYFENQRQARDDFEPAPGFSAAFKKIYGFGIQSPQSVISNTYEHSLPGNANLPYISYAQDLLYGDNQWLDQQQYAAFAQADYNITSDLKGTIGMRYEYATQNYFRNSFGILSFGNVFPFTAQTDTYAFTPKFSLDYSINDDVSVYGTISKGFRLGGPTGPVASSVCGGDLATYGISAKPTKYGPDKLWSYEAGAKSRLMDNRVTINADAFYISWDNIQQQINLPSCGASITQNFGSAESYGTEFEVRALVTPELTLGLSGDITRAVITDSPNSLTARVGQEVLNVPKYTFVFSADYDFPINDQMDAFIRGDYDLVGSSKGAFAESDPAYNEPEYGVLNGSLGMTTGPYEVSLYAKNLTNNQKVIQRPAINFTEEGYTLRPLTVGVRGSMKF
jgi:outer membrane receptor protein involved in Fe transport